MTSSQTSPFRFGRFAPTLPVRDTAVALAFYEGALGFRRVFENGDPVGFVVLRCDDAEFHLTLQPDRRPASFNVMHMMVGDVDAVHEACRRSGLRVIKGARDHEHGLRAFVFADPDGNRIDVTAPVSGKT